MNEKQLKADAINEFVSVMIGAFESGFVDKNNPTLAEIHRVAHHHVNDNYGIKLPNIVEQWGEDLAKECAKNKTKKYLICDENEQVWEAKDSLDFEETKWLLNTLREDSPDETFTMIAELSL